MEKKVMPVVFGLIAVILALASYTASAQGQALNPLQELYKAAKAEGKVLWQTSVPIINLKPLIDGFQKKYPDIKLTAFYLGGTNAPSRIITESQTGNLSMDLAMASLIQLQPLLDRDLIAAYDWTKVSDVNPKNILLNNKFIAQYDAPPTWFYNTKFVSAAEAPKSYEDLLNPRWKGKIVIPTGDTHFGQLYHVWKQNPEKAIDILKKLRANQEFIVGSSMVETPNRVASGEAWFGVTLVSTLPAPMQAGAPLALCPMSPTTAPPYGMYVPKKVKNPNAARLLMSWLASKEAAPVWVKSDRGPATPCDASSTAKLLCDAGIKYIRVDSEEGARDIYNLGRTGFEILGFGPK